VAAGAVGVVLLAGGTAEAQQKTFHLDRLEVPGGPDDGIVLFRPVTQPQSIFYGQLGIGFQLNPLHVSNITTDPATLRGASGGTAGVVKTQLSTYASAGFEFADRVLIGVTWPVAWLETGANPDYPAAVLNSGTKTTTVDTSGPAFGDLRLDARGVIYRTPDRTFAFGGALSLLPGTGSVSNFGGDGQTTGMVMVNAEYSFRFFSFVAQTGLHFRPKNSINDPVHNSGLGIGDEWRWAVGAFLPLAQGKIRLGATIFGQTGIESDNTVIGDTIFTAHNSSIEWNVEGRMRLGARERWWVGAGGGTRIANGYGAPDLRLVGLFGAYVPILDSDATSPERRSAQRDRWRHEGMTDTDNDGIPDDIDACPTEPEDHKGSDPNDGCPMPADRDGDGIPDQYDKCPDQAEDFDGVNDEDGCPETDADNDGIPDAEDACPREPGQKSSDPKKNGCPQFIKLEGSVVKILQQVHFQTASANILPDSFPMLTEIANLLKANPQIKRMAIEGHTDNRGPADFNKKLSDARAASVRKWLEGHGVEGGRLESHGYGLEKPIEDNNTDKGRAANRRVEFRIVEEDSGAKK
jgi:outer membrane protein OmpA-like peptidoglycan-associated protein